MWSEALRALVCLIPLLVATALGQTTYLVTLGQGAFFFSTLFLPRRIGGRIVLGSLSDLGELGGAEPRGGGHMPERAVGGNDVDHRERTQHVGPERLHVDVCLLYTSDAADEEDSVDLGG